MVGQNLGAKKPDRAERAVWIAGFYNMIFLGSVGVLFILFTRPLIGLFTSDPQVLAYGVDCLRFISFGFPLYAFGMCFTQAFNGAGDTWTPTKINLFCFWLWEIPLWCSPTRGFTGANNRHDGLFDARLVGALFRGGVGKRKSKETARTSDRAFIEVAKANDPDRHPRSRNEARRSAGFRVSRSGGSGTSSSQAASSSFKENSAEILGTAAVRRGRHRAGIARRGERSFGPLTRWLEWRSLRGCRGYIFVAAAMS
jgi:hypothetical protein